MVRIGGPRVGSGDRTRETRDRGDHGQRAHGECGDPRDATAPGDPDPGPHLDDPRRGVVIGDGACLRVQGGTQIGDVHVVHFQERVDAQLGQPPGVWLFTVPTLVPSSWRSRPR